MRSKIKMNIPKNELPGWDLSDLYASIDDPKVKADIAHIKKLSASFARDYKGRISGLDEAAFLESVRRYEEIDIISGRLMEYAFLQMCTRMENKAATAFYQNTNEQVVEANKPTIFYTLELNKLSDEQLEKYLKNPEIAHYRPWLNMVRLFKKHELSEEMEELLADKAMTSSAAWERLYVETSSKQRFNVDGKEYNEAEMALLLQDKDPETRAKAGRELNRVAKENADLYAMIYNMLIKDKAIEDDKRGFARSDSAMNLSSQVDDSVVDALAAAVKRRYGDLAHRFYKLKARWLGVDKIQYWDRNAPLPFAKDESISWEQSVKTVLDAYGSFSKEFQEIGRRFFENPWIDVPPRPGKQSGAFCAGTGGMPHPYLLLNFNGKERDVLTLAHELGHGCHHILCYPRGDLNDQTPKVLAEVASVFAEMVTFQNLVRGLEDNEAKLSLIAGKVSDMINTVSRQIAFHFYESRMHRERKKGEVPVERIREIWVEEMRDYLGEYVNVDEHSSYLWAHLSHVFEQPFYVYAYAFADCLVNSLYQVYRDKSVPGFEKKYLEMLSETGIKRYDELLKPFGLDARSPEFWDKGMNLIAEYIGELERLSAKLGL